MPTSPVVPSHFPRSVPAGAVPGAQPKLLTSEEAGRFIAPASTDAEIQGRYEICEDLVHQLLRYSARKQAERPDWNHTQVRDEVAAAVRRKAFGWGVSPAEAEWIVRRLVTESSASSSASGPTS